MGADASWEANCDKGTWKLVRSMGSGDSVGMIRARALQQGTSARLSVIPWQEDRR